MEAGNIYFEVEKYRGKTTPSEYFHIKIHFTHFYHVNL